MSTNGVVTNTEDTDDEVTSRLTEKMIYDYERHKDRVYTMKLDMLYNNIQDHGINPEHCWDLIKIADEMIEDGYGTYNMVSKLGTFKENFVAHGSYYEIWQPLWFECKASIPE